MSGLLSSGRNLEDRERLVTPKDSPRPPKATKTSRRLNANERNVVPEGQLPKPLHQRISKTSYPATSGMGALAAKTGGSYAFDKSTMRPEDIATVRKAVQHSPGVRAIAEITRDPLGIIQAVGAAKDVVKHPGVGTGIAAGLSGAGLFFPGARKLKEVAAEAKPLEHSVPEESDQVRAAISGRAGRQALKKMGKYEKVGAKIDNPNLGKSAKALLKEQDKLRSAERSARVSTGLKALNDKSLTPEERIAGFKNANRGELPKINFMGHHELNDESVKVLQEHILDHPYLMPYQKIRAAGALTKALSGEIPQRNELDLLEHVFGKDTAEGIARVAKHPMRQLFLSVLNIPRSIMASFDLSAPFRQGLVVATRHPAIFAKNFKPMIKAFGSEAVYHATLDNIRSRPSYPMMLEAKLSMTELGKKVAGREEQFASDLAETLTGGKHSPIRMSGRAYTAFLDKTRADVFDHLINKAQSQGINVQDEKFLKDLGRYINSSTGRGPLGHFKGAATALNAIFFSPRLLASRLDLIFAPATYAKADPFVRKEALRSMFQLAGAATTLVGLASQIPGVKTVTDPRNPDWGKIKVGNTRIDIGGGFQQPLRLFAQIATGTAISSTTGKKLNLTAGGFGNPTSLDIFLRFLEGKESPIASLVTDKLRNSDQIGRPFEIKREVRDRLIPLLGQDLADLYHDHHGGTNGIEAAFAGAPIGALGFGLQTYGPKKPKVKASDNGGFGSSGLLGSGGGGFSSGGGLLSSGG